MARTRNWSYFKLEDATGYYDSPYGVLRFNGDTGRVERYDPAQGDWFYSPRQIDVILGGEAGATQVDYSEVEALIQGGKMPGYLPEFRADAEAAE